MAPRLLVHRGHLSIGLHLNLTLGQPLGHMPRLAPQGTLAAAGEPDDVGAGRRARCRGDPRRDRPAARSLRGGARLSARPHRRASARARIAGRPARPAQGGGAPLPCPPAADARSIRPAGCHPFPPHHRGQGARRRGAGHRLRQRRPASAGCTPTTVSRAFRASTSASPMPRSWSRPCRCRAERHLVMCHPGHPDAELASLDPVVNRRRMEYEALMADPALMARIWRPSRDAATAHPSTGRSRTPTHERTLGQPGAGRPAPAAAWAGLSHLRLHLAQRRRHHPEAADGASWACTRSLPGSRPSRSP